MSLNILLVDPDAGMAEEIRRAFAPLGFSVTALGAGDPAVERCRQQPPDLILLAAELPDMSGFSVCNRLKRAAASVPLILYTAEATEAAIEAHRATRTRADDYLKRPFEVADLLARAAALLRDAPAGPPAPPGPPPPRPDGRRPRMPGQEPERGPGPAAGPPPVPPPVPGAPAGRANARPRPQAARPPAPMHDPADVLAEWPRDPAPPKGTPEQKLEYFRERLRARDAFLAKVRDAVMAMRAQVAELTGERDLLQAEVEGARQKLSEGAQDAAAQAAQMEDLRRQLAESENTRQSLSDVLSETMQQHETAEQQWSARVAAADAERARVEADLATEAEAHARAVAAAEAERADERARFEAARAETEDKHARGLQELEAAREQDRAEASSKTALAEEQITALGVERDGLAAEAKRLEAEIAARTEDMAAARREAEGEADALRARVDEASARGESLEIELTGATAKIEALEEELARAADVRAKLEEELRAARNETRAYEEKSVAVEHAYHAKEAELAAAAQRVADLSAALDEGRASVEGTRGELARIEGSRAEMQRRAAQIAAERDQLAREVDGARRETAAVQAEADGERERVAKLEAEIVRLSKLEPVAEEAMRLRKEVGALREMVSQRTTAAESSSRAAQAAASERARAEERLAVEGGRLQAQLARAESEVGALRRKLEELEKDAGGRETSLRKAIVDAEERRRALVAEGSEAERRHGAEVARLKAAMVDLERHLEARARAELQLKKRVQELEHASARPSAAADPAEVAKLKARLEKLAEEADELKSENEFLNGEVARYVQKNKELTAKRGRG